MVAMADFRCLHMHENVACAVQFVQSVVDGGGVDVASSVLADVRERGGAAPSAGMLSVCFL